MMSPSFLHPKCGWSVTCATQDNVTLPTTYVTTCGPRSSSQALQICSMGGSLNLSLFPCSFFFHTNISPPPTGKTFPYNQPPNASDQVILVHAEPWGPQHTPECLLQSTDTVHWVSLVLSSPHSNPLQFLLKDRDMAWATEGCQPYNHTSQFLNVLLARVHQRNLTNTMVFLIKNAS